MAFTCNYMVGTGFLTLPHAMVNSGLVLGVGVLIFMAWLSVVSVGVCTFGPAGPSFVSLRGFPHIQ
jgi:hypothetical protein